MKSNEQGLWDHLSGLLHTSVSTFSGIAGVCVRDLTSGFEVSVNGSDPFPTASTIKMHILAHLLERSEAGELNLSDRVTLDSTLAVPGSGVLTYCEDPVELSLRDVATLMIIASDNTATNLCIDRATMVGVNGMIKRMGLHNTVLQRKMQDHDSVRDGNENLSTPADMVNFLVLLQSGSGLAQSVCEETLRVLKKPKRGYLGPGLPEDVVIASKAGGMDKVRNDAALVYLRRRPYALCIMTTYGVNDRRQAETFVADVAHLTHKYMAALDASGPWGQGVPADFR